MNKLVHNIKLPFAYSQFNEQMLNQLKAGSFEGTKVGFSNDVPFFLYARAMT